MNQSQKREYVEQLAGRVKGAQLIMLADFRGVSVAEVAEFRSQLAAKGVVYEVVKNTLGSRAVADTDMAGISQWLKGMTGWVISTDDPIAAAKVVRESTKALVKEGRFILKGGYFDGEAMGKEAISKVADLPSREELLSTLLRTIQEGPRQLLGVIQAPARDLLYLLKNYETKLSEGSDE